MNIKTNFIALFACLYLVGCNGQADTTDLSQEKPVIQTAEVIEAGKEQDGEKPEKDIIVAEPATSENNREPQNPKEETAKEAEKTANEAKETTRLQWKEMDAFKKTISFSKIAKTGKVSVFVLSTPWCGPCKELKEQIAKHPELSEKVDFYYINMAPTSSHYKEMEDSPAYKFICHIDRLKEWPRVIITSQTGSIVKSFSATDLKRECQERSLNNLVFNQEGHGKKTVEELKEMVREECGKVSVYEKTLGIVNRLLEHKDKFKSTDNIEDWQTPRNPTAQAAAKKSDK